MLRFRALSRLRSWAPTVVLFFALSLSAFKLTGEYSSHFDVDLYDETLYLAGGSPYFNLPPDWAPLYSAFYSLHFLFESDPLEVYFANARLLSSVLPAVFFLTLRILGMGAIPASFLAFFVLLSRVALPPITKVHLFGAILILIALSVGHFLINKQVRHFAYCVISLLLAFARPELLIAFALFLALFTRETWKEWAAVRTAPPLRLWLLPVLLLGFSAILLGRFGFPIGSRGALAFQQNFAATYSLRIPEVENIDSQLLFEQFFGKPSGFFSALLANPVAVAEHLLRNCLTLAKHTTQISLEHFNLFHINGLDSRTVSALESTLFSLLVSLGVFYRKRLSSLSALTRIQKVDWLSIVVFALPFLVSVLVFHPWERYLTVPLLAALALIGFHLPAFDKRRSIEFGVTIGLAALMILFTPRLSDLRKTRHLLPEATPNHRILDYVRSLPFSSKMRCYAYPAFFTFFFGDGCEPKFFTEVSPENPQPLGEQLQSLDIAFAVVLPPMDRYWRKLGRAGDLIQLFSSPSAFGYEMAYAPEHQALILWQKNALTERPQGTVDFTLLKQQPLPPGTEKSD